MSTEHSAQPPSDSDCLDWLEMMANQRGGILLHDGSEGGRLGLGLRPGTLNRTLRQAIAAAIQSGNGAAGQLPQPADSGREDDPIGHPRSETDTRDEIELFLRDAYSAGCHAAQTRSMTLAITYANREAPKLRAALAAQGRCDRYSPVGPIPDDAPDSYAEAYIRDWCPDHVKAYIARKTAPPASPAGLPNADTARLDWLERHPRLAEFVVDGRSTDCYMYAVAGAPGVKLREIIDATMASEPRHG